MERLRKIGQKELPRGVIAAFVAFGALGFIAEHMGVLDGSRQQPERGDAVSAEQTDRRVTSSEAERSVRSYLRAKLGEPDSLEDLRGTNFTHYEYEGEDYWKLDVTFRAKNRYGGYERYAMTMAGRGDEVFVPR